jgi:hypothetical protein
MRRCASRAHRAFCVEPIPGRHHSPPKKLTGLSALSSPEGDDDAALDRHGDHLARWFDDAGACDIVVVRVCRFEPYALAKRSLTGDTTERVDTRVLQAIYEFAPSASPAFVGQQVVIAAPSRAAATRSPTSGQIAFNARRRLDADCWRGEQYPRV